MASETARTAWSCPTTRWCNTSSIFSNLSRSPSIILATGMPVMRDTISATSSAPTLVRNSLLLAWASGLLSIACSCCPNLGSSPYSNSEARAKSPWRLACSILTFTSSICFLMSAVPADAAFSAFQISSKSAYSFCKPAISSSINSKRFLLASSLSFSTCIFSILSWMMRRSSLSICSGLESNSILMRLAASSIKSMALSGRKRSVI